MSRFSIVAVAIAATIVTSFAAASPADARSRFVSVQGRFGPGYTRSRSIHREPGHVSASRSFQANNGRGITSNRHADWGNGSYSGGASHTLNDGRSFGRNTTATNNGDGTASYSSTRTRLNGSTRTVSGTVPY